MTWLKKVKENFELSDFFKHRNSSQVQNFCAQKTESFLGFSKRTLQENSILQSSLKKKTLLRILKNHVFQLTCKFSES